MSALEVYAEQPAAIFAALGDPTRLAIVSQLRDGRPRSIVELSEGAPQTRVMTRQAVTKHLRVLEGAGLVAHERAGRESRFILKPERFGQARTYLEEVSALWDDALGRLKAFVEDDEE
jgi:DNA-binding transcriptional ArsR family regulator